MKCPQCNNGEIRDVARAGRRAPFRATVDLEIPADIAIPTCTNSDCGEEWIDSALASRILAALEGVYQTVLSAKAENAIEKLKGEISQKDLERLLGLSAGYLSKLKHGKETTAPLVAVLMLLANDSSRVDELRRLWAGRAL